MQLVVVLFLTFTTLVFCGTVGGKTHESFSWGKCESSQGSILEVFFWLFSMMKKYCFIVLLTFSVLFIVCFIREFPFDMNFTEIHNFTDVDEFVANFTEYDDEARVLETESVNVASTEKPVWTGEASPIFKVLRDFLFQAREGLIEPLEQISEGPIDVKTDRLIRVLEQGLIEATTVLMSQMESSTLSTLPSRQLDESPQTVLKRQGETPSENVEHSNTVEVVGTKKRQTQFDKVINTSTSCSDCYNDLQSCVSKCFTRHNCNDIQRNARTCPPTPSRLCNPFTPWNPVDECQNEGDCRSPQLCCNDGCINKCVPGVWRS